jgi:hypothetical protein
MDAFAFDAFLNYSPKDASAVESLAHRLRSDGLRVWFGEWEIIPGEDLRQKIENALNQSRALILCMSANAFAADWPQLESRTFRFRDSRILICGFRRQTPNTKDFLTLAAHYQSPPTRRTKSPVDD